MEFHILELPKIPKEWNGNNDALLLWAKFIASERKEDFDMLAEKNPYIGSAYEQLQIISQDKQKRLEYEAREKAIRDYNQLMFESEQRGIEKGIEKGRKSEAERINKLNKFLLQNKRYDDLELTVNDKEFQQQLMSKYGI